MFRPSRTSSLYLQVVHLSPQLAQYAAGHPQVGFVSFTGSVVGGRGVERAALSTDDGVGFKGVGLEVITLEQRPYPDNNDISIAWR